MLMKTLRVKIRYIGVTSIATALIQSMILNCQVVHIISKIGLKFTLLEVYLQVMGVFRSTMRGREERVLAI